MLALKSKVNLTKSTTKVYTHDAYTVLFMLQIAFKLWLVVVVNVIITITS